MRPTGGLLTKRRTLNLPRDGSPHSNVALLVVLCTYNSSGPSRASSAAVSSIHHLRGPFSFPLLTSVTDSLPEARDVQMGLYEPLSTSPLFRLCTTHVGSESRAMWRAELTAVKRFIGVVGPKSFLDSVEVLQATVKSMALPPTHRFCWKKRGEPTPAAAEAGRRWWGVLRREDPDAGEDEPRRDENHRAADEFFFREDLSPPSALPPRDATREKNAMLSSFL